MKTFWALFVALVAASIGMTAYESREQATVPAFQPPAVRSGGEPDQATPDPLVIDNTPAPIQTPTQIPTPAATNTEPEPMLAATPVPSLDALLGVEPEPLAQPIDSSNTPRDSSLIGQLTGIESEARMMAEAEAEAAKAEEEAGDEEAVADGTEPDADADADPGFTLNGYPLAGAGTAEDPYLVDWPLLESISRQYAPRMGLSTLPDWVKQIDGKRVRVEGYIMLPMTGATDEVLAMRNQWDGCCLGLPPTPYNAVEVRLEESLPPTMVQQHAMMNFGKLEGTFKVDPYVLSNYLMGLWLMEDATLTMTAER